MSRWWWHGEVSSLFGTSSSERAHELKQRKLAKPCEPTPYLLRSLPSDLDERSGLTLAGHATQRTQAQEIRDADEMGTRYSAVPLRRHTRQDIIPMLS